jgi:endonuclease III
MKNNQKKHKQVKKSLSKKSLAEAKENFSHLLKLLEKTYPDAHCALDHKNALELLMATILSAQCTDKRVNLVTPDLFAKYKTAADYASAKTDELEALIRSTGFYHNKAKNIIGAGKVMIEKFQGRVPATMEELLELPGVARKTANVVLWNAFGKNEGVVVDTHVQRTSYRLGWTAEVDPKKIEKDLQKLVPREKWGMISHLLIFLGRDVCKAPKPICGSCRLRESCPWFKEVVSKEKESFKKAPKTHKI